MAWKMYPKYGLSVEELQTKNIIYKITFYTDKGERYYIGQTNQSLNTRLKNHIIDSIRFNNTPIHRAIQKYGLDSCKIEIIDKANNRNCLNKKEIFWIKYYKSFKECGYNCSGGGGGIQGFKRKKETLLAVSGENNANTTIKNEQVYNAKKLLFEGKTPIEASKLTEVPVDTLYKVKALLNWVDVGSEFNEYISKLKFKNDELSYDIVEEIKIRLSNGDLVHEVAKDFNLQKGYISRIKTLNAFKNIRSDLNDAILTHVKRKNPQDDTTIYNIKRDLCDGISPEEISLKYNVDKERVNRIKTLHIAKSKFPEFNEQLMKFKKK